ncbi:MAG: dTDP-4-dehydrorhamnose 3,5-epimerase family protein [Sulfitobacter sp.]
MTTKTVEDTLFPRLTRDPITLGDGRGKIEILHETTDVVLKRSTSAKGVFRGLHRQVAPHEQTKIIRVLSGQIIDFVTDPDTDGDPIWYSEVTPADDWVRIAPHLAHGFYALTDVVFEYFCEGGYNEAAEESWFVAPIIQAALDLEDLHLSDKDKAGTPLQRKVQAVRGAHPDERRQL